MFFKKLSNIKFSKHKLQIYSRVNIDFFNNLETAFKT